MQLHAACSLYAGQQASKHCMALRIHVPTALLYEPSSHQSLQLLVCIVEPGSCRSAAVSAPRHDVRLSQATAGLPHSQAQYCLLSKQKSPLLSCQ